jgi:maltose alpha-D-glucosyltransferase/alpha-amylase
MLGGDRRRLEMAHSLQFSLRGTPVLRYGEEIGMGDLLRLPGRDAIRTPMQWSDAPAAGFTGEHAKPVRPLIATGPFGYASVNVADQHHDPASLLSWFERMLRTLRQCHEVGAGSCSAIDKPVSPGVFIHRCDDGRGSMLFVHNLSDRAERIDLGELTGEAERPYQMFGNDGYPDRLDLGGIELDGYGYRWIRLRRDRTG